ncbi:hypothetical protein C7N43_12905 [Sphingobacteriales bacterium UPWRP_1]|nr:hypothetical protein BVG80_14405 [Sphingobacteriales bacterium TSM_CSM]PSJ76591.1 hypothetical protein C7N43_12905 [Sphingobacteriales bacterium UPWRP_1]
MLLLGIKNTFVVKRLKNLLLHCPFYQPEGNNCRYCCNSINYKRAVFCKTFTSKQLDNADNFNWR